MYFEHYHILPLAGGLHDQPEDFVQALQEYRAAKIAHEQAQAELAGGSHGRR